MILKKNQQEIISREIGMTEKFYNFHSVEEVVILDVKSTDDELVVVMVVGNESFLGLSLLVLTFGLGCS